MAAAHACEVVWAHGYMPSAEGDDVAVGYLDDISPRTVAGDDWSTPGVTDIVGSPSELARWGEHYSEPVVVSRDALAAALAAGVRMEDDSDIEYAAGIITGDDFIGHAGYDGGISTDFAFDPESETTLAISCNGVDDTSALREELLSIWILAPTPAPDGY